MPSPTPVPSHSPTARHAKRKLPQLLQEVEAKYSKANTLVANFSQVNEIASLKQKKTSAGRIEVKRPDKVRWETKTPDANLLISDGKHFWFYTPPFDTDEHGQLIERSSAQVNSRLAQALLSGSFSVAKDMKISKGAGSTFKLSPKKGTAGSVIQAIIEVDPTEKVIRKVTLIHDNGNTSEIALSDIKLGETLKEDDFVFVAPPNTDRVKE